MDGKEVCGGVDWMGRILMRLNWSCCRHGCIWSGMLSAMGMGGMPDFTGKRGVCSGRRVNEKMHTRVKRC